MRSIKMIGLAIVAVLAFGATAAVASAHEFTATKGGLLLLKSNENQKFKTKAGEVVCKKMTVDGTVKEGSSSTQAAVVKYSECTVFGFIGAVITPADYTFSAEGSVEVTNEIEIEAAGCLSKVPPQTDSSVSYKEAAGGALEIIPAVTNISSMGTGSSCEYSELPPTENKGTYKGEAFVMVEGSTLGWK